MTATVDRDYYRSTPNPLHGTLLAGTVPLALGTLLSDIAYYNTYEIQWTIFASWLNVGGLVFAGLAALCAIINLIRVDHRKGAPLIYFLLLAATWIVGFFNALQHAKDAWAAMPESLILSVIVLVLACLATWMGLSGRLVGGAR